MVDLGSGAGVDLVDVAASEALEGREILEIERHDEEDPWQEALNLLPSAAVMPMVMAPIAACPSSLTKGRSESAYPSLFIQPDYAEGGGIGQASLQGEF